MMIVNLKDSVSKLSKKVLNGAIKRKLSGGIDFAAALEKAERDIYVKAYKYHKQNQTLSAKALGVARGTFLTKMKHWGELK